jgi:type IV pilus assembly protein PilC
MPTFVVEVKNNSGKVLKEKVEANTPEQARVMMKAKYPAVGKISKASPEIKLPDFSLGGVSIKDKAIFSRQFSVMIDAGVAIVRCLGILAEQCPNPKFKKSLMAISADVQEGMSLSESMRKHPQSFDKLYISMVDAGETGGVLDETLTRLAKLLEDMVKLKNQVKSAMTYPVTVGLFAVIVFICMTVFLIPIFAKIFTDLGTELPALTQFMVFLSSVMRSWLVLIPIAVFMGLSFLLKTYYKTPVGKLQIDGIFLQLPLFGDLNRKTAVARFCRVFGTLTQSGVPILKCLENVRDTIGNQVLTNAISKVEKEIQQGGMLSLALQQENVFPALAIQMLSIGEETGEIDKMMMKVADFYEDEVEQTLKALTSIIEPIMMVGIAVLVGTILLSMYLPMFAIFDQLG